MHTSTSEQISILLQEYQERLGWVSGRDVGVDITLEGIKDYLDYNNLWEKLLKRKT